MSFANAIYLSGATAPIESTDTVAKHPLGTRMVLDDGRVFVYAKAGAAITRTDVGVENPVPQGISQRAVGAAAAVGDTSVTFTTVSPDGITGDGSILEDEFVGGYVLLFTTGAVAPLDKQIRRITGNTATAAAGEITMTLDRGLEIALATATSKIEAIHSPYAGVTIGANIQSPIVGVASCLAGDGEYLWIQTWGVCWLSLQAGCGVAGQIGLTFRHDGSLSEALSAVSGTITNQYAGFVLAGIDAATQAAPFIMLQISP